MQAERKTIIYSTPQTPMIVGRRATLIIMGSAGAIDTVQV